MLKILLNSYYNMNYVQLMSLLISYIYYKKRYGGVNGGVMIFWVKPSLKVHGWIVIIEFL